MKRITSTLAPLSLIILLFICIQITGCDTITDPIMEEDASKSFLLKNNNQLIKLDLKPANYDPRFHMPNNLGGHVTVRADASSGITKYQINAYGLESNTTYYVTFSYSQIGGATVGNYIDVEINNSGIILLTGELNVPSIGYLQIKIMSEDIYILVSDEFIL